MEFSAEEFQRLLDIFKEEGLEYIQRLGDGLLKLEKDPKDITVLEDIFRNAHNLKGAARILGLSEIAKVAHDLESIFSLAKEGKLAITPERIDTLSHGIDAINSLITKGAPFDVKEVRDDNIPKAADEKQSEKTPPQKPGRRASDKQFLNTVRVSTEKLDIMMNQVGELLVAKMRFEQRLEDINSLIVLYEYLVKGLNRVKRDKLRLNMAGKADSAGRRYGVYEEKNGVINDIIEDLIGFNDELLRFSSMLYENQIDLDLVANALQGSIKNIRMLPLSTIFETIPMMVRDLSRRLNKKVSFKIQGEGIELDKRILEGLKDPVVHLITNCIDHGIEPTEERRAAGKDEEGLINVAVTAKGSFIEINIEDDGRGVSLEKIKEKAIKRGIVTNDMLPNLNNEQIINLIFEPGFSTSEIITDISGRGVGMDVVKKNVEDLNGMVFIQSDLGKGCKTTVRVPFTLVTVMVILIEIGDEVCALPETAIDRLLNIKEGDIFTIEGSAVFRCDEDIIPINNLSHTLGFQKEREKKSGEEYPVIVIGYGEKKVAFIVDDFIGEEEIVIKTLTFPLTKVKNVAGAAVLGDGRIAIVLNPVDLIDSARGVESIPIKRAEEKEIVKKSVLIVDDSITTRILEKNILESSGYDVTLAVDGVDAYNKLQEGGFDIIVLDVQMPNMDGFSFTEKVRGAKEFKDTPIILLTSLESDEDKRRGIEAGADAYIVKRTFNQDNLLETIKRLI
ncbi:MAG: hybrid sensor histidine kinase/response regulator [Nitrospirae bacterium]|nr:hybrid sensor histidine kinase/response regulator [Nitrospirota bacterium]